MQKYTWKRLERVNNIDRYALLLRLGEIIRQYRRNQSRLYRDMVIFPENEDEDRFPTLDNAAETCYMRYLTPIFPVSFSVYPADRNRAARFAKHDSFPRRESALVLFIFVEEGYCARLVTEFSA